MSIFVLSNKKEPLMPCSSARARQLLKQKKAAVYRTYPFTIILINRSEGDIQTVSFKCDPGSKTSGISLVGNFSESKKVLFAANLEHRGLAIKSELDSRRANRRSRRNRKTRYREPRFLNRTRPKGWLAPSLESRVNNIYNWVNRLKKLSPIEDMYIETVRFDTQLLENPEISGVEYQQGKLTGYEVREYLLEKWNRTCAYCGVKDVPLEIEHIVPKSKRGSNSVNNLAISCRKCNERKGSKPIEEFLKGKPEKLKKIKTQLKRSLRDTAAINSIRYAIGDRLKEFNCPISFWSGGRTKFNRIRLALDKDHWIDSVCVGNNTENTVIPDQFQVLTISANGRGSRQMCRVDKYGFPRTGPKQFKSVHGFKTGDIVRAVIPKGKYAGSYVGRISVRASGSFDLKTGTKKVSVSYKYLKKLHAADGYSYSSSPYLKKGVSAAKGG